MKHPGQRPYDWFGYAVWFCFGMVLGGLPLFVFDVVFHTIGLKGWQVIGLLTVCCMLGGLGWGRKHRRQWERENVEAEMLDDVLGRR